MVPPFIDLIMGTMLDASYMCALLSTSCSLNSSIHLSTSGSAESSTFIMMFKASVPPMMSPRWVRSISAGISWGTKVFTSVWMGTNESTYRPEKHISPAIPRTRMGCFIEMAVVFFRNCSILLSFGPEPAICDCCFSLGELLLSLLCLLWLMWPFLLFLLFFFFMRVSSPYITVTPTNSEDKKHMIIPISSSFPKSWIMGTDEVKSEKKPSPVIVSAISTAGPVCLMVSITACASSSPRSSSSSIRLWNWMA